MYSEAELAGDSETVLDRVGLSEVFGQATLGGRVPMSPVSVPMGRFSPPAGTLPVQRVPVPGFSSGGDDLPQNQAAASEVVWVGVADEPEQARGVDAGGAADAGDPIL